MEAAVKQAITIHLSHGPGDILIFMTGQVRAMHPWASALPATLSKPEPCCDLSIVHHHGGTHMSALLVEGLCAVCCQGPALQRWAHLPVLCVLALVCRRRLRPPASASASAWTRSAPPPSLDRRSRSCSSCPSTPSCLQTSRCSSTTHTGRHVVWACLLCRSLCSRLAGSRAVAVCIRSASAAQHLQLNTPHEVYPSSQIAMLLCCCVAPALPPSHSSRPDRTLS